jgi:hypothetical protein
MVMKVRCILFISFIFIATSVLAIDCPTCPYHYCPTDIVTLIEQDIVIPVPGTLPIAPFTQVNTIQDALSALDNYKIASGVTATIQLTQNVENYDTVNITHPDGDKIRIVGNCGGGVCTIQFKPGVNGVYVANGNRLGFLDNLNLIGQMSEGTVGICAFNGGSIECGTNVVVQKFYNGVYAVDNSFIHAPNIKSENNSGGLVAGGTSIIYAPNAVIDNNGSSGVVATAGSSINMPQSRIEKNAYGVYVDHASTVVLDGSTVTNNRVYGVNIVIVSSASARGCVVSNNVGFGLGVVYNGIIDATGSVVSGNNPNTYTSTGGIIFGI